VLSGRSKRCGVKSICHAVWCYGCRLRCQHLRTSITALRLPYLALSFADDCGSHNSQHHAAEQAPRPHVVAPAAIHGYDRVQWWEHEGFLRQVFRLSFRDSSSRPGGFYSDDGVQFSFHMRLENRSAAVASQMPPIRRDTSFHLVIIAEPPSSETPLQLSIVVTDEVLSNGLLIFSGLPHAASLSAGQR
jgi:hypothetical protein